jgi:carbonic anhydrase/acetyltransferase-like protein (isoleucine patch superfamily)
VIDPTNTRHRPELVDPTAYIAPGAVVLGNVTLGAESSV